MRRFAFVASASMARSIVALMLTMAAVVLPANAQNPSAQPLVFAAASLKDALDAVAADWQKETGKRAVFSYAASSALARQIESGAPADIFISADLDWMDWAEQHMLIQPATRETLLGNTLVLIAAADSKIEFKIAPGADLAGVLGNSRLGVGEVSSVPAGKYAKEALENLGLWSSVANKLAPGNDVRAALNFVARGEARLGIVYGTDARAEPKVKVVDTFPETSHPPILYPAALVAASRSTDATAFLAYLRSPAAVRDFTAQGFTVVNK
jgi:molybdate transport system substrate-binding protein